MSFHRNTTSVAKAGTGRASVSDGDIFSGDFLAEDFVNIHKAPMYNPAVDLGPPRTGVGAVMGLSSVGMRVLSGDVHPVREVREDFKKSSWNQDFKKKPRLVWGGGQLLMLPRTVAM